MDLILTGATRGIGHALALLLASREKHRLILLGRDPDALDRLVDGVHQFGGRAIAIPCDLASLAEVRAAARYLAALTIDGATLVHNAGVWPWQHELSRDGFELGYAVNVLAPLALQQPLLERRVVRRVLTIGAGIMVKGRFDRTATPAGDDFSSLRTYCNTKLALAVAMRDAAASWPAVDFAVIHPGVVQTGLGARPGIFGALLKLVKRGWEPAEVCAERLLRVLARPRWSSPGIARWLVEETEAPWPAVTEDAAIWRAVREAVVRDLAPVHEWQVESAA